MARVLSLAWELPHAKSAATFPHNQNKQTNKKTQHKLSFLRHLEWQSQDDVATLPHAVLRDWNLRLFPAYRVWPLISWSKMVAGAQAIVSAIEEAACSRHPLKFQEAATPSPWPELGPLATFTCKECWEMYLFWIDIYLAKNRILGEKGKLRVEKFLPHHPATHPLVSIKHQLRIVGKVKSEDKMCSRCLLPPCLSCLHFPVLSQVWSGQIRGKWNFLKHCVLPGASVTTEFRETWDVSEPRNRTWALSPHHCAFWNRVEFLPFPSTLLTLGASNGLSKSKAILLGIDCGVPKLPFPLAALPDWTTPWAALSRGWDGLSTQPSKERLVIRFKRARCSLQGDSQS